MTVVPYLRAERDARAHGRQLLADRTARDRRVARRRPRAAAEHRDRRRLARAVVPEEAEDLFFFRSVSAPAPTARVGVVALVRP